MRNVLIAGSLLILGALLSARAATPASDAYAASRERLRNANPTARRVPVIPPVGQQLRVIIDTDAHNEIDDGWALALALVSPERFKIEGIVAANYDNDNEGAGPASVAASAATIRTLLEKAGRAGEIPVKPGSPPMRYQFEPSGSAGADFIVERAMASTPEDPLWIIGLGAATDLASAYLQEPRIADRVVVFWHGRTEWPQKANNFNVHGDVRAARILFHSNLPLVLFDTGSRLFCPMEESARWADTGELGRFLHEYRAKNPWFQSPTKGFFDLGDIAALVDPSLGRWEVVAGPELAWDLTYRFRDTMGRILRCADVNRDGTFALLTRQLQRSSAPPTTSDAPARVIFDTDVGGDIDDAGALAMLHALADRGEIELLAIGVVNGHEAAVPYVDAVNTWYGRPDIPIGTIKRAPPFARDLYMAPIVATYPHDLTQASAPEVVSLYRKVLAAQPDGSVTFVEVGPSTNLSHLLDSPSDAISPLSGVELVRRKVKHFGGGGNGDGKLPRGKPGFNYHMDMVSARNELAKLPSAVPLVLAGGSGWSLKIGSCFWAAPPDHIVRKSYELYFQGARDMDRPTWDQLRVLYACRPAARAKFKTSEWGEISLNAAGELCWQPDPDRRRAFAYIADVDAVRTEITELMLQGRRAIRYPEKVTPSAPPVPR